MRSLCAPHRGFVFSLSAAAGLGRALSAPDGAWARRVHAARHPRSTMRSANVSTRTAKLLGLGFPGGPAVERAAKGGDPQRFALPRPMWRKPGCDFSFSGLKTAVRQAVEKLPADDAQAIADFCASFSARWATSWPIAAQTRWRSRLRRRWSWLGGVAANVYLRGGSKHSPPHMAPSSSRRRSSSAPTMAP